MLWNILYKTIETYCFNYKKNIANRNFGIRKTKQIRLIVFSNCAIYGKKNSGFVKNRELH